MAANLVIAETREMIREKINDARGMIEPVLPKHVDFDTCLARMYKHMFENNALVECTPASVFWGFVQAAEVGLSIGGFFGEGFLIPYGSSRNENAPKKAKFVVGYKGLLKLCYQSPLIRRVDGYMVFQKDHFVPNLGSNSVEYRPYLGLSDPGNPVAAYTQIEFATGAIKHHVMAMWALERIRKGSPGSKKQDHPWNTHTNEMYRKTGLRSALKDAPKNSDTDRAIELAIRHDELADNDAAYDSVPDLGLDTGESRSQATKARVTKRAEAKAPATPAEPPAEPPQAAPVAAPVATKAQPQAQVEMPTRSGVTRSAPVAPKPASPPPEVKASQPQPEVNVEPEPGDADDSNAEIFDGKFEDGLFG